MRLLGVVCAGVATPWHHCTALHCAALPPPLQEKRKRDWLCHKVALSDAAAGSMGSVVGVLLSQPSVEIKLLGVELLTEFTKLQVGAAPGRPRCAAQHAFRGTRAGAGWAMQRMAGEGPGS